MIPRLAAMLLAATVAHAADALDLTGARMTLDAVFTAVPPLRHGAIPRDARALDDPAFVWLAGGLHGMAMPGAGPFASWATLPNNHEMQAYPNGDAIRHGAPDPFAVVDGGLAITARPLTPAERGLLPPGMAVTYGSGALSSYPFGQIYGYFEMTARLPRGQGLWPAFWLLPVDDTWPPEIDVVETLGQAPATAYTSLHTGDPALPRDLTVANAVADTSEGFHRYGVDWGPEAITFYFDRRRLLTRPTPADMHKPFYITMNLAVGGPGSWPGAPDAATVFPARMLVKSVQVWQR